MNNNITSNYAMMLAIEYAGFNFEDTSDRHIAFGDGLYEISFRTMFMAYEAYVDAQSGEVLGFNFEPVMPNEKHEGLRRAA